MTPISKTSRTISTKEAADSSNIVMSSSCKYRPIKSNKEAKRSTHGNCKPTVITSTGAMSNKSDDGVGIYINRFGKSQVVAQMQEPVLPFGSPEEAGEREIVIPACARNSDKVQGPDHPFGSPKEAGDREIVILTRIRDPEVCRDFGHGFCEWGKRCRRIHHFDMFNEVNRRILHDVFKGDPPKVAPTKANINEACLLYIEGRCKFDCHCHRIHLIPPSRTFTDAESELKDDLIVRLPPPSKPLLPPTIYVPNDSLIPSLSGQFMPYLGSHLSLKASELPELERWGCETEASTWLDTDSDTSEGSKSSDSSISSLETSAQVKHPPPRNSETCRRWLKGCCERGYSCIYVHKDLEYDERPFEPRPAAPPFYMATIHDHIRVKFGAGFGVQEVITGFETPWLYVNNIPNNVSQDEVTQLLSKHGTVQDFRSETGNQRGTLRVRVRFSSDIEARNANIILNGTRQWGSLISTQLPVNTAHGRGATLQNTAVRIEWEAPSIIGYAGYPTEERAKEAIAIAKTAYYDTYISAHMYSGLPQMAAYTVRFLNLPVDTKKEQMSKYSKPLDMMWDVPNYTSVDEVATFLRRRLESNGIDIISFEVLPPPYRDGRVRAWVHFPAPVAAKAACQLLHLRKPMCTGRTRIFAYHVQSLSYSILLEHYKKIQDDILLFRERLRREVQGTTFTVIPGASSVTIRLSAIDGKDLSNLKAEFEHLRGGEVVKHDGEVLWDRFFGLPAGKSYLRRLEIAHLGIAIREDAMRRRLTLFGQAALREVVKAALTEKHNELLVTEKRCLFLGPLIGPFIHSELGSLSQRLGPEKVVLDMWNRQLVVSGKDHDFRVALQAVQKIQRRQHPHLQRDVASCPVCLGEVDCPVTLPQCKHSYCRACLISYLQAAIDGRFFPLTCLGNDDNCSSPLSISLARQVLSSGEFDSLIEAAFEAHIHERPEEFHYCPSPDCMQVYRPAPSGNILQCPSCLLRICPQCHVEQHDGFECPDRDGGDHLFNEWARTHNVKNCPSCRVPIERAEGCNHVTCIRCRTHICWVCMRTFPRGDGIYNHMRAEHGGIGNAFDDDGL
ncbi:hypothetical protein C8J55DRAFT_526598 [Lentinula edodes]|uniref:RBR-type E3 ubiquitin transferase n=1 Tax=Lentinula lateritia TaxID=40482 RepID=A0A9W8ZU19_9AGAR|nr:hypothetical protein C8J55DRAFT_526598 [Lentinula edodes]